MLENIQVVQGNPSPLGLSFQQDQMNFAVFSQHATKVYLGLFRDNLEKEIPLNRSGDIWHAAIKGLTDQGLSYAFRCEGPYEEKKGLLFKSDQWLIDPYARKAGKRAPIEKPKPFDWQDTHPPHIPLADLIIYEMHARGFTKHSSSGVRNPGTFLGLIEKIPHLKKLGINAVELLPIFAYNDQGSNYWGYQPLHFFALMPTYAISDPIEEFKTVVREFHRNGIEVILDVVFNHTGEGDLYINFRGIDNPVYYMIDDEGKYLNFSGCGNTLNCNHPAVQRLILDSLRYWVEEMQVDGFRFDMTSTFTRDSKGNIIPESPILKAIAADPVISKVKLIAEPWDVMGVIQVGSFPKWGPWSEWNCTYRDTVRRFMKGTVGQAAYFGNVISGNKELYPSPLQSISYIASHDGFTIRDLVTYNQKHNEVNGEKNRDGMEVNESWNCGAEGPTQDPKIIELRERQMRNYFLALFLSQGIPMLLMGDEYGHTRLGNNNPYNQDNDVNWFLWNELEKNPQIFTFVSSLITFRKQHPNLRHSQLLTDQDIEWHGTAPFKPDWSPTSKFVALTFKGTPPLYLAFNAHSEPIKITLPPNIEWHQVVKTDSWDVQLDHGPSLPASFELVPYSALLARGN